MFSAFNPNAANAASAVYYAANAATKDTNAARAAENDMKLKILRYGIKLLRRG